MRVRILEDAPEPWTAVNAQPRGAGFATPARSVAAADLKMGA
ncbi:hypothetical protein [Streptomyces sp. NPDC020377]